MGRYGPQQSWSRENPENPYGPAMLVIAGTSGRHVHGTNGPMNGGVEYLTELSTGLRTVTRGCVRIENREIVDLAHAAQKFLETGGTINVYFVRP